MYIHQQLSHGKINQEVHLIYNSHQKIIKYPGINLIKEEKSVCKENCKTLMTEIEERTKIDIPCSWIGIINIVKMTITIRSDLQIECNPYENASDIIHRNRKHSLCMGFSPRASRLEAFPACLTHLEKAK